MRITNLDVGICTPTGEQNVSKHKHSTAANLFVCCVNACSLIKKNLYFKIGRSITM